MSGHHERRAHYEDFPSDYEDFLSEEEEEELLEESDLYAPEEIHRRRDDFEERRFRSRFVPRAGRAVRSVLRSRLHPSERYYYRPRRAFRRHPTLSRYVILKKKDKLGRDTHHDDVFHFYHEPGMPIGPTLEQEGGDERLKATTFTQACKFVWRSTFFSLICVGHDLFRNDGPHVLFVAENSRKFFASTLSSAHKLSKYQFLNTGRVKQGDWFNYVKFVNKYDDNVVLYGRLTSEAKEVKKE